MDTLDIFLDSLHGEWERLVRIGPRILMALLTLAVAWLIGRGLARLVGTLLQRTEMPRADRRFFQTACTWLTVLAGLVVALNLLGLQGLAASLVASGGVTAVVLGFAFRAIGENFLAGLSLVMDRSFRVGDLIRSGEFEGHVRAIKLRHTHIRASDGRDIFIPSIELFSKPVVNFTRDGLRRFSFRLGIDYASDTEVAGQVLLDAVRTVEGVLEGPHPGVRVHEFADNHVVMETFFWVDTLRDQSHPSGVRTRVMEACRRAVREAGFTVSSEVTTGVVITEPSRLEVRSHQA